MKLSGSPVIWDINRIGAIIYEPYYGIYYKSIAKYESLCFIVIDTPLNEIELKMKFKDTEVMIDNELKTIKDVIISNNKTMKHSLIGLKI